MFAQKKNDIQFKSIIKNPQTNKKKGEISIPNGFLIEAMAGN